MFDKRIFDEIRGMEITVRHPHIDRIIRCFIAVARPDEIAIKPLDEVDEDFLTDGNISCNHMDCESLVKRAHYLIADVLTDGYVDLEENYLRSVNESDRIFYPFMESYTPSCNA